MVKFSLFGVQLNLAPSAVKEVLRVLLVRQSCYNILIYNLKCFLSCLKRLFIMHSLSHMVKCSLFRVQLNFTPSAVKEVLRVLLVRQSCYNILI